MWRLLGKIAGIAFTVLLWYLQEIPSSSQEWYDLFLKEHKIGIALFALIMAIGFVVIDCYIAYYENKSSIRKWVDSFLKHIIKEHLSGRNFQTRISILRPCKGYEIIIPYLLVYPLKAILYSHYKICNKAYWENIPYKLFDKYLIIYARYGHSDNVVSYTHFLLTERDEPCNGIADKCFKEELEQEVCTDNITNIHLPQKYMYADRAIKKYMQDSYIDEKYYDTLLLMNTKANNLYAIPIFNENQRIWGVMVIDNDSNERISYKEKLDSHIAMYQKIFSYTLQILK